MYQVIQRRGRIERLIYSRDHRSLTKVRHQMFKGRTFERIEKDLLRSWYKGKIKKRIMQALGAGG
jgi:hypothetical protein